MPDAVPAFVWVEQLVAPGARLVLGETATHHVARVCRARSGDHVTVTDGRGGLARYRLLPLRGWKILAAKDAAFLMVAIPLTLPLAPLAAAGAALVALALGHEPSVSRPRRQMRWRFSSGGSLVFGILQAVLMAMAGAGISFSTPLFLVPCLAGWAFSLWHYGRVLDQAAGLV